MGEIRHNITFDSPRVLEYLGAMPGSVSHQLHTSSTLLHLLYHSLLQILNTVGGVISDYTDCNQVVYICTTTITSFSRPGHLTF